MRSTMPGNQIGFPTEGWWGPHRTDQIAPWLIHVLMLHDMDFDCTPGDLTGEKRRIVESTQGGEKYNNLR